MTSLIYILNNYSSKSVEHFYHVVHLLETLANKGVKICLVLEKADEMPLIDNTLIECVIIGTKECSEIKRLKKLYEILLDKTKEYKNIFIRISNYSTLVAIAIKCRRKINVYYWHSGTVFEYDNEQPFNLNKIKWYFKTRIPFNIIKKHVDYFVTGPESMLAYYTETPNVSAHKIKLLYNDIDISRFDLLTNNEKSHIRESLGFSKKQFIYIFVHRFSPVRKTGMYIPTIFDYFFQNVGEVTNVRFVLIGGGPDKDEIERAVKEKTYSNYILFKGSVQNSEIQKYYQAANVYINPTHAEGFPRTVIEAMACGLPIITTNAGGTSDLLPENQQQYVTDIEDPTSFAKNLITVYNNFESISELGKSNREYVRKFSTDNVADMYINLLQNFDRS